MRSLLAVLLFFVCPSARLFAAQRPNIVLILADDLGYGDAGCYGATKISTPNIDRLAREGMRFTDAHSPHSVCTPTRYSLLTGRYAWRNWAGSGTVWANDPLVIEPGRETIASQLQSAGYETACVGKWHLGFGAPEQPGWDELKGPDYNQALKPGPLEVGFDSFFGIPHVGQLPHFFIRDHHVVGLEKLEKPIQLVLDPKPEFHKSYLQRPRHEAKTPWHTFENTEPIEYTQEEMAVRLTEEAVQWIDRRDGHRPFFLYFAHRNPHVPWKPHPRFVGTSDAGNYGDFVHEFDWSVGEVLAALDRKGMTDNTLVILSSDNGACNYRKTERLVINGHKPNGELRGQKTEVYEGGHRVPMIVRWPGEVEPNSTSDALVALTDWFSTFAEMLDETPRGEGGEDSFSILPVLTGNAPTRSVRTTLVSDSYRNVLAIRAGPWKLIPFQGGGGIGWAPDDRDPAEPSGQLFHLATDVTESNNRHDHKPETVRRLTDLLREQRISNQTSSTPNSPSN